MWQLLSAQRGSGLICCPVSRRNGEGPGGPRGSPQPVAALLAAGRMDGRAGLSTAVVTRFIPGDVCRCPHNTSCHSQTPAGINPSGVCWSPKPCSGAQRGGLQRQPPLAICPHRGHRQAAQPRPSTLRCSCCRTGAEHMMGFPSWGGFRARYIPSLHLEPPSITFGDV